MEKVETGSADVSENEEEDVDLFGNNRRMSITSEAARRVSLGLPDNGAGLTKAYYNINRPMSVTSLVDLIVLRRTGNANRPRRSSQLSEKLEERIKKTLAWKEMEDELNKEDVMVNFRKKMREKRKVARQSIPKETKIERRINEDRRIQLRTSLLEPDNRRQSTTESVKEAIQEFRMRQPAIIEEETKVITDLYEDKETLDVIRRTRELLEKMGYLTPKPIEPIEEETSDTRSPSPVHSTLSTLKAESESSRKKSKFPKIDGEKFFDTNNIYRAESRLSQDHAKRKIRSSNSSSLRRSSSITPSLPASKNRKLPVTPRTSTQPKKISSGQIKNPLSQRT